MRFKSVFSCAAGGFLLLYAGFAASQSLPASTYATGQLISPSSAYGYYGASAIVTSTQDIVGNPIRPGRSPEIKALAKGLGAGEVLAGRLAPGVYAQRAAQYVKFNLDTTFTFGLSKGSHGALIDQSANSFDAASLLVDLLREGGIPAGYEAGTITLTAQQWGGWSGLVLPTAWDADGRVSAFTVSAKATCQLLANGGVPAVINGSSEASCNYSGDLASVTMAHVWVSALGTRYDPSFKKMELWKGRDLPTAMQCGTDAAESCSGGAQAAAMTGVARGILGGTVPYVQNVNKVALDANLSNLAQRLQSSIRATDKNLTREQMIGGATFDASRNLLEPLTPIGASGLYSWQEVPDQYRIRFSVQFDNINKAFWADELAARRLRLFGLGSHFAPPANSNRTTTLYVEFDPVATSLRTDANLTNDSITLTVNYPYAALGGAYQDTSMTRDTFAAIEAIHSSSDHETFVQPVTIVHQFGSTNPSSIAEAAQTQEDSKRLINLVDPTNTAHNILFSRTGTFNNVPCLRQTMWTKMQVAPGLNYVSDPGCLRLHEPTMLQHVVAEDSEMQRVVGAVGSSVITTHGVIGSYSAGAMNFEPARSVVHASGDVGLAAGAKLASSLLAGWLEGGVFEQDRGEWEGQSGLSLMIRSNEKGHRFLQVTSANVGAALGQLTNYGALEQGVISGYATSGYRLAVPQSGQVGTYSFGTRQVLFFRNGLAAYKPDYAALATLVNVGFKGGLPGVEDPGEAALKTSKALADGFQPAKLATFSLNDASLRLLDVEDLSTGAGSFPDRLSLTRSYSSANPVVATEQTSVSLAGDFNAGQNFSFQNLAGSGSVIGGGWKHNYEAKVSIGSDGFQGLGADSAIDASGFLAGVYTLVKLGQGSANLDRDLAGLFTAYWTGEQLVTNVVTVKSSPVEGVFTKLPDGSFNPPPTYNAKLVQVGQRQGPVPAGSGSAIIYDYSPVTFQLTDAEGGVTDFNLAGQSFYSVNLIPIFTNQRDFKPTKRLFADGKYLKFEYTRVGGLTAAGQGAQYDCLTSVANHVGRSLTFKIDGLVAGYSTGLCQITAVTTDQGQTVTYDGVRVRIANGHTGTPYWGPFTLTVTKPDASKQYYDYNATMDNPAAVTVDSDIVAWRSDASTFITAGFDDLQRLDWIADGLGNRRTALIGGLFSEKWKWTEEKSAMGARVERVMDNQGRSLREVNPVGAKHEWAYDPVGRLRMEIDAELGSSEIQYDVKSNAVRKCGFGKSRLGNPCTVGVDLIVYNTYVEATGPDCVNFKVCTKVSTFTDARGTKTAYVWSPDHGLLLSETRGLNGDGACVLGDGCPVVSYGYSSYPALDGTSFYLLTSKTEKVDATSSIVTAYEYEASNHFALKAVIADPGALGLRTCFEFDPIGNLIRTTAPRAGACS